MFVASCSTTTFTEYRGSGIVEGKGGTVRVVDGIDFWENGPPNRKFRIIGVIDDSRGDGLIQRSGRDGTLAKVAKERGGDAIIFLGQDRELRGITDDGAAHYRRMTKIAVVRYVN